MTKALNRFISLLQNSFNQISFGGNKPVSNNTIYEFYLFSLCFPVND